MSDYDNARRAAARSALRRAKLRARRFELEKPERERELKEGDLKERELMRHQRALDLRLEQAKRDSTRETLKNVRDLFITIIIIFIILCVVASSFSLLPEDFFGSNTGSGRQYDWGQERRDQQIPKGYFDGAYHGY